MRRHRDDGGGGTSFHALRRVGDTGVVGNDAQVHRHLAEGVVRRGWAGIHSRELDVGVAQPGAVEEQGEGVEQLTVGPMVGAQRRPLGAADGVEVGVHVGAAEAEDRLLRVADGDQPMIGEGAVEDLPLQPIGVLELVDEDEAIAARRAGPASCGPSRGSARAPARSLTRRS